MDIKTLSIDRVGLSNRSRNALHRIQVYTVGDLFGHNEESLSKVRNLGAKSIEEILGKIKEYKELEKNGELPAEDKEKVLFEIPSDFDAWILEEQNRALVTEYLTAHNIRIDAIELLSVKSYNLLMFNGYDFLHQVAFLPEEKLLEIPRMDSQSADEIIRLTSRTIKMMKEEILGGIADSMKEAAVKNLTLEDMLNMDEYKGMILEYVKTNDIEIEKLGLSNRPKNRLLGNGDSYLSDIVFRQREEFQKLPAMGTTSVEEIMARIRKYLSDNEKRILAHCSGDDSALWSDEDIGCMIFTLYQKEPFKGFSLSEIVEGIHLPEKVSLDRLKSIIGKLIASKKLEYVDFRLYRIYGKFERYIDACSAIDDRSKDFIHKRLAGLTLDAIGHEYNLTRERVRQVVKRDVERVGEYYSEVTRMNRFDEDYYRYFYETYAFDKRDASKWLGIPMEVWNYLDLIDAKQGEKSLEEALEDNKGLSAGMRLKIKNYLNRDKIFIDGMWVEKKRGALEKVLVKKFCKEDVTFDEFAQMFNSFLEQEEIPFDEELYYTDAVYRTRKNRLSEAKFLLWTHNETIRYYDIEGQDFTELLDTLNLDAYENIELSTLKFMNDYPDVMKRYDIRNQYELHNILRKIVEEGSYHDFACSRMPDIKFGTPDRDAAIFEVLANNAPIRMEDLAELVYQEFGFDKLTTTINYLTPFSAYCHQGIYTLDFKEMPEERRMLLSKNLTKDFYYIDEVQKIYINLFPDGDIEELNPYSYKMMGFSVYSRYILQNYPSLDAYFGELLTSEDLLDITPYRQRYGYVQAFTQKVTELKRNLEIIEYEPNKVISFRKLETSGITKEMIQEFCDAAHDMVCDGEYFSIQSLKHAGFDSELYDLGFSDWFYASLLISDERFTYGQMFGTLIFRKGKELITTKSFEMNLIKSHGVIDVYDLMTEMEETYGCKISDKSDLIYKVQDTEIYYDSILDRFYSNADRYYKDLDEAGI